MPDRPGQANGQTAQIERRLTGTIKWYNRKKGFGFVTPDGGGEDVFLHRSTLDLDDVTQLDGGERITFQVEQRVKGPAAVAVEFGSTPKTDSAFVPAGSDFADLGLPEVLLRGVAKAGYVEPTPIQAQAIPALLAGQDLVGCARTGTGKTAAFALPILNHLDDGHTAAGRRPVRALVLSPTRELAIQIGDSFDTYGRFTGLQNTVIYGGVSQKRQVRDLERGVDIIVATPGRLLDLMGQGFIQLDQVQILVLDEADRMLDMGFIHDMRRIIRAVPAKRQTMLFSATMPKEIVDLADSMMQDPIRISVSPGRPAVETIEQAVYFVTKKQKQALLQHVLQDSQVTRALVFTRTKHGANKVVKRLTRAGIQAEPIHGNKSQNTRQRSLRNFRSGKTRVLVATDVVARGIDVDEISHVIQFDLPNEPAVYIHRVGRTGRAGADGIALSFCDEKERAFLKDIEKLLGDRVPVVHDHPYTP